MNSNELDDSIVPYFAWDRNVTVGEIKKTISNDNGFQWIREVSWIMREAAFDDVWQFLSPKQIQDRFLDLKPLLGRKRDFWQYILEKWHELGRI